MVVEKGEMKYTLSYKIESKGVVVNELSISCSETEKEMSDYVKDFKRAIINIRLTNVWLKRKRGGK